MSDERVPLLPDTIRDWPRSLEIEQQCTADIPRHGNAAKRMGFALGIILSVVLLLRPDHIAQTKPWWRSYIATISSGSFTASMAGSPLVAQNSTTLRPSLYSTVQGRPGFLSYADYAGRPIVVTYDERAVRINGTRTLFLGGSMHPVRATPQTWNESLDEAVANGLNLITLYVMWSHHQAYVDEPFDWSLPSPPGCDDDSDCRWTLPRAIRAAGDRGLWVHVRLGPYACAEYTYGGIPASLAIFYPNIVMRHLEPAWMNATKVYLTNVIEEVTKHDLWAYQGGPIVMAQIENEIGSGQGYTTACADMARKLAPQVVWTMCNGLTANNTIETFNGMSEGPAWLDQHGFSGRIQVDQPAMWTEDEGGFQIWGESAQHPIDYFWGRTARAMSYNALQWFARGGLHLNYYMWWGGYNRERQAAAGIMNMYASDAVLCASGDRRQPKFDHFTSLHDSLQDVAHVLINSPTALNRDWNVLVQDDHGRWIPGEHQIAFAYTSSEPAQEVIFVENNSNETVNVMLRCDDFDSNVMLPYSAFLFVNGFVKFDSANVSSRAQAYVRRSYSFKPKLIGTHSATAVQRHLLGRQADSKPLEFTQLLFNSRVSTDYVRYWTSFNWSVDVACKDSNLILCIDTTKANAMLAFVDEKYQGSADNHEHAEGNVTLIIPIRDELAPGEHQISILSESLGYHNLVARWFGSTGLKAKGIVGHVTLRSTNLSCGNVSLVDGRAWTSDPTGLFNASADAVVGRSPQPAWTTFSFTLGADQRSDKLRRWYARITQGRGHLFLNGNDLGRFWNITRDGSSRLSQSFYHLPTDYLYAAPRENALAIFDVFGNDHSTTIKIWESWIESSPNGDPDMIDVVDYQQACL